MVLNDSVYSCTVNVIGCALPSARAQPLFSHIYIIIVSLHTPKSSSIFGLHRQPRCQKFCLGSD